MGTVFWITLHVKVDVVVTQPSDLLIPSDYYVMLQQTECEGVVQMILRSCVYLVQKRPNFTFNLGIFSICGFGTASCPGTIPVTT